MTMTRPTRPNLPSITTERSKISGQREGVVFVVFAPFGTDTALSTFPDGSSTDLLQHPLVRNLLRISEQGSHVIALIDRTQSDTFLLEIPAFHPKDIRATSRWKQDMGVANTLTGLLHHAASVYPNTEIVLALEGHGAGFLPEIDRTKLLHRTFTNGVGYEWRVDKTTGAPTLPVGTPVLPVGTPVLPVGTPVLPSNHLPLSTYGLGKALAQAAQNGVPKLAVIHFNNCFNMSVEMLHTVAPYADFATGYPNYNFFTAGEGYEAVFAKLRANNGATSQEVATWFAEGNQAVLAAKGNHPTAGCVIRLDRMFQITEKIDDLADALLAALRNSPNRVKIVTNIRDAIIEAQQYDTTSASGDFTLETPDEMTDIRSFALALKNFDFENFGVHDAADALVLATVDIKQYGERDRPWVNTNTVWDFRGELAMNIFMPDPLLLGVWDWRAPFYLDVNPDPALPRVQPGIIDFVQVTDWVDFIIEYHKTGLDAKPVLFKGLRPAVIPEFPLFNRRFEMPKRDEPYEPKPPGAHNAAQTLVVHHDGEVLAAS